MKKALSISLLAVACLFIFSCKGKNPTATPPSAQESSAQGQTMASAPATAQAKALPSMPSTILALYKAYCTVADGESKTDSILSVYCTDELRKTIMEAFGEYDVLLSGYLKSDILNESLRVARKNEKYVVYFEYTKLPDSDEPGKDSVYVMVNKENKISYIIRPIDNYRLPSIYIRKSALIYYFEHQYIDLGLSINWATCDIGSTSEAPQIPGQLFAWGETEDKVVFSQDYYLAPKQDHYYEGKLSFLEPSDDAATVLWGEDWRMPTKEEFQELIDKCEWEWTKEAGSYWGYRVTGPNGNSIFLPAGGMRLRVQSINRESGLYYWTGSCRFEDPEREPKAWGFCSTSDAPDKSKDRNMIIVLVPLSIQSGRFIRPVTTRPFVPIRDISLNKSNLRLDIGEEFVLTASFFPQDATPRNIYWHSGNSAVAYIDSNGKVIAVGDGKCTITAVCGDFRKECQVTVVRPKDFLPAEPQKTTTIYEFGKDVDSTFVDQFLDLDNSEELKEIFSTSIGDNSDGFTVTLSDFAETWERDPGDYCLITIKTANGEYQFWNYDWARNNIFENHYFYCQRIDKSKYLLFFKGFDYSCCPGVLTVIAVDATGARVVYNKECDLIEINEEPFSMTTVSWWHEYVSKYKAYYSSEFNLFIEDNALKHKRVMLVHD